MTEGLFQLKLHFKQLEILLVLSSSKDIISENVIDVWIATQIETILCHLKTMVDSRNSTSALTKMPYLAVKCLSSADVYRIMDLITQSQLVQRIHW